MVLSGAMITPAHRYVAGEIDREAWLESHHLPATSIVAEPGAAIALAEALGRIAADMWIDGRLDLRD